MKKRQEQEQNTEAISILQSHNLKITKNRIKVLNFLISAQKPLSIEDLTIQLKKINHVTIYRILKLFVFKGIVYQTDFRQNTYYYEFQRHHHHHITCKKCNLQESISMCIPNAYVLKVQNHSDKFSIISDHSLEFFGICKRCEK